MTLSASLRLLVALFGAKAVLHFLDGVGGLYSGASYGDYGDAFVNAGFAAYIAYGIWATRSKWVYWLAVVVAAIVVLRFALGTGLIFLSQTHPPTWAVTIVVLDALLFGVIPLLLLALREVRGSFFPENRQ
jgi:predicted signal transduction protein with EAL and GGDEF domain